MQTRPRINRWTQSRRDLIFGTSISQSLVQPHFVVAGENINQPIDGMPGIHRQSVDVLLETISNDVSMA
jgi:delta-aminolevulinic acid dehydratase/porphobilinogen synthase